LVSKPPVNQRKEIATKASKAAAKKRSAEGDRRGKAKKKGH
jgi:hypothetical protein